MRWMTALLCCLLLTILSLTACSMKPTLPRNMELKAFDPHRKEFTCMYEVDHVPPVDPEAEAWFQEGMRVTGRDLQPNQRNYPLAVELWQKAADKQHWKAILNLAGLLIRGDGIAPYQVEDDQERAVLLIEKGMQLGIPSAFDMMGNFHQSGAGVKADASRAYAFWELAAYKGSPSAQTFLGKALDASYDDPEKGFWENPQTGLKMLECAFAQGYGKAAHELGLSLDVGYKDYPRALTVFHEGVKMGCEDCANYLSSSFRHHDDPMIGNFIDIARSERYDVLGDALYHNPDLKFPNLDKVLPLPPAKLPVWNGKKDDLINAAKGVVLPPKQLPPHPSTSRHEPRFHIRPGFTLPAQPVEVLDHHPRNAMYSGYWLLALPDDPSLAAHDFEMRALADLKKELAPRYYRAGEVFGSPIHWNDDSLHLFMAMHWSELSVAQRTQSRWEFYGHAIPLLHPSISPLVTRKLALCIPNPTQHVICHGNQPCPNTGIWQATIANDHPHAALWQALNGLLQQGYVQEGDAFPSPRLAEVNAADVSWHWLGEGTANTPHADGRMSITVPESWQG